MGGFKRMSVNFENYYKKVVRHTKYCIHYTLVINQEILQQRWWRRHFWCFLSIWCSFSETIILLLIKNTVFLYTIGSIPQRSLSKPVDVTTEWGEYLCLRSDVLSYKMPSRPPGHSFPLQTGSLQNARTCSKTDFIWLYNIHVLFYGGLKALHFIVISCKW